MAVILRLIGFGPSQRFVLHSSRAKKPFGFGAAGVGEALRAPSVLATGVVWSSDIFRFSGVMRLPVLAGFAPRSAENSRPNVNAGDVIGRPSNAPALLT
jgi:hypothetical protein